jgi:hypothetical protein
MTRVRLFITSGLFLALAGCTPNGSPKTVKTPLAPKPVAAAAPEPPPEPLSVPQTQVELPKAQPLDLAALQTITPQPAEPPPAAGPRTPVRTPRPPVVGPQQKPEPAAPPPAAAPAPEPERPRISEVVAPTELKRLQDQAQGRRKEVAAILVEINKRRRLTQAQRSVVNSINSFVNASSAAEKRNDMRQADALAEKAQVLARGLMNEK